MYTWFPLAVILAIYLLIARFYHRFSGERTYYWFFIIPIIFYGAAAVRDASLESTAGDPLGDLYGVIGGVVMLGLTLHLFWKMTRSKQG